jgi:alpha-D-ribose 1-methylphosphonate 5-triphosphate synthase subunit PhnG
MRFLEEARARDALRQAGAAYQFRHARLQEQLVARAKKTQPRRADQVSDEKRDYLARIGRGI